MVAYIRLLVLQLAALQHLFLREPRPIPENLSWYPEERPPS